MMITILPVMPPDLRPMVQLDGGRYASSDINDLYRRVINRNNRLKHLLELKAPEVIIRNEKRMLQEAVDSLIDNSARRGKGVMASITGQRRLLKSVADMLKGKQGRFRQNLLGKRVDYSGRSVIVVGPELKLRQCGLPKRMALEIFKPFVIADLIERDIAYNIRMAGHLIQEATDEVWAILEEVIKDKLVLLNRAPTLHRLGVQAFQPLLVEGQAIQIHPMVCRAFNADFDGDQMAVHLPLTEESQKEASSIMLSSLNLLKPATGEPIVFPTQDIVLGIYWITRIKEGAKGEGKIFSSKNEALFAYESGIIDINAKIKVLNKGDQKLLGNKKFIETSAGQIIFNSALQNDFDYIDKEMNSKALESLMADVLDKYGFDKFNTIADKLKTFGFEYATISGISWGVDDLKVPPEKFKIIREAEKEEEEVRNHYQKGFLSEGEKYTRIVEIWTKVKREIEKLVPASLDPDGPVSLMVNSGARGSWAQPVQMSGMRGLVANPAGRIIELPIKSSFKEGCNVLEYFISTHGARKGTADTALRTAKAGYLTRRLVDVAQDVSINENDCGTKQGIILLKSESQELGQSFSSRLLGRVASRSIIEIKTGQKLVGANMTIDRKTALRIENAEDIKEVFVRSPLTCELEDGLCQMCFGYDLGKNSLVDIGEAVGIVAAQSIGEPGTQLTMRTFHTGGIAGAGDITQGLPRVEEIFEARSPKGTAVISRVDGTVDDIINKENQTVIKIRLDVDSSKLSKTSAKINKKKGKNLKFVEYKLSQDAAILVHRGDHLFKGDQISEGHIDLKDLFKLVDQRTVEKHIINEVQKVYVNEGAHINDKHIEIIAKKMFSRVKIEDNGDTDLIPGEIVTRLKVAKTNKDILKKKGRPATFQSVLLGITRVSLSTDSFLSAASFQETARVLIRAATEGATDNLRGLKENVIIGKLIPAGTGLRWKWKE